MTIKPNSVMKYRVGIYEIVNTDNGKRYIGSTVDFAARFGTHRRDLRRGTHYNQHLQRSWNKSGETAFEFRGLLICDRRTLLFYEQLCIDGFKPEFNVAVTAGSRLGLRNSAEQNANISKGNRGKKRGPLSAEHKAKLREIGLRGNHPPPPMTYERREQNRVANTGRVQSAETIAKRVVKLKAVMSDSGHKAMAVASLRSAESKRVANLQTALRTAAFREAKAIQMIAKWSDPAFRAKTVAAMCASKDASWAAKQREGIARINMDPEFHRKRNEGIRRPEVQARIKASIAKPECAARKRAKAVAQRARQEALRGRAVALAKMIGVEGQLPNHRSSSNLWLRVIADLSMFVPQQEAA